MYNNLLLVKRQTAHNNDAGLLTHTVVIPSYQLFHSQKSNQGLDTAIIKDLLQKLTQECCIVFLLSTFRSDGPPKVINSVHIMWKLGYLYTHFLKSVLYDHSFTGKCVLPVDLMVLITVVLFTEYNILRLWQLTNHLISSKFVSCTKMISQRIGSKPLFLKTFACL